METTEPTFIDDDQVEDDEFYEKTNLVQNQNSNSNDEQKPVDSKMIRTNIFNYSSPNFKRDPTIDIIVESRKSNFIENAYTILAQTTSQRIRSAQQARLVSAKLRTNNNEPNRPAVSLDDTQTLKNHLKQFELENGDDGITGDFDKMSIASIDKSSLQVYEETCKRLKICPCSTIIRRLNTTHINLANYGLGPRGCAALAVALVRNTSVISLDLSGNDIGSSGMSYIYQIMTENAFVEDYILSNNKLGSKGIRKLAAAASYCVQLRYLDISGNQLVANDVENFLNKFEEHPNLKYLNISHNLLDEQGAISLGKWLSDNNVLLELNASWCSIRLTGARALAKAVGDNNKLSTLNLSHNSFNNETIENFIESLSRNLVLAELNLEGNQISCRYKKEIEQKIELLINGSESSLYRLFKAALTNQSLKRFRLGKNYLDRKYLLYILKAVSNLENISLEELDLTGLSFDHNDISTIHQLFTNHNKLTLHLGSVRYTTEQFSNNLLNNIHRYCQTNQTSLSDFFTKVDESYHAPITSVDHQAFLQALKRNKIPFLASQINQIMKFLSDENDGEAIFLSSLDIRRKESNDFI